MRRRVGLSSKAALSRYSSRSSTFISSSVRSSNLSPTSFSLSTSPACLSSSLVQHRSFFRLIDQFERGVTLTLGKLTSVKQPGFRILIPFFQEMHLIDVRTQVSELQSQEIITRDNVAANVSAVCYFRVVNPELALLEVTNFRQAIEQLIQTEIRDALCQQFFSDILNQRNKLSEDIKENVREIAKKWGVDVERVQMKKIDLVDPAMVRAMAKEAEASRERIAAIIRAEGELDAAKKLLQAANMMGNGTALELRRLQTLEKLGKERGQHTVVIPVNMGMGGGQSARHEPGNLGVNGLKLDDDVKLDPLGSTVALSAAFGTPVTPHNEETFTRAPPTPKATTIDKGIDDFNSLLEKMK